MHSSKWEEQVHFKGLILTNWPSLDIDRYLSGPQSIQKGMGMVYVQAPIRRYSFFRALSSVLGPKMFYKIFLRLGLVSVKYELRIEGDIFYSIMKRPFKYTSDQNQHSPAPSILRSLPPLSRCPQSCLDITLKADTNPSASLSPSASHVISSLHSAPVP